MLINIPPKVWRPKQVKKFIPLDVYNDIEEGVFDFKQYRNTVFIPLKTWTDNVRDDLILYGDAINNKEIYQKYQNRGICKT